MSLQQKIFAILVSVMLLILILEMVRRRKIKEEYSWLWLLVGASLLVLSIWFDLLMFISRLIGAEDPTTTLFLFGFIFILLINLDYSAAISQQKEQIKKLTHEIAIMKKESEDSQSREVKI